MTNNKQSLSTSLLEYDFLIAVFACLVAIAIFWSLDSKREPTPGEIDIFAERQMTDTFQGPQVEFFSAGGSGR